MQTKSKDTKKRLSLLTWICIMFGTTACIHLFSMHEREVGRLETHVSTIAALDCFVSMCESAPNDQSLKYLVKWLDQEERLVSECPGIVARGSYADLRDYGLRCARHARDRMESMARTDGK